MKSQYVLFFLLVLSALSAAGRDGEGALSALIHQARDAHTVWTSGIHPSAEIGFSAPSNGYGFGADPSVGVALQYPHFMLDAGVGYGFVRKVNDNDQVPHEHGHTRAASVSVSWRRGRNFIGPGASWGETAVTPYRKYSWAPEISAGHDFNALRTAVSYFRSLREYIDYPSLVQFTPGPGQPALSRYCICSNGVSGVGFDLWQAPGEKALAHVLLHYSFSMIHFHETVTDPYNTQLTAQQKSDMSLGGTFSLGVVVRH
jgi:hypothetical protein